jgi:hypothetical protein
MVINPGSEIGCKCGKHRREMKVGSTSIFLWLIRNGFPSGFRVLCSNCYFSHGHYGYCPHKRLES